MERRFIDVFKLEVVDRSRPMALYRIMKFICDASLVFLSIWRHYVIFPIVCNQDRAIFSRYIEERCFSLFLFISLHRWKISSRMEIHAHRELKRCRNLKNFKFLHLDERENKIEIYRLPKFTRTIIEIASPIMSAPPLHTFRIFSLLIILSLAIKIRIVYRFWKWELE